MKRLVATFNFGPIWYADFTTPYMRRYAQRVGADFLEYKSFPNWKQYSWHPGWFHVEAIRIFAAQDYYDEMLLLDADTLPMPDCPDLFALSKGNIAVVQDLAITEVDHQFQKWCRKYFSTDPEPGPYFNAGVIVLPRDVARRIVSDFNGPFPDEPIWENHYLNLKFRKHCRLTWLPSSMNWTAPQFPETALKKDIVHFVGAWKDLIPSFIRRMNSPATAGANPEAMHSTLPSPNPTSIEEIYLQARLSVVRNEYRLPQEVLDIEGMSDMKMRHLLNRIGAQVRTYVEVGSYHGSTLIAAAFGNEHLIAIGIDDFHESFSAWNTRGEPGHQIDGNLQRWARHSQLLKSSFADVDVGALPPIDCFFYDGAHDFESHRDAVIHFSSRFADECLFLVDDWNGDSAREGTYQGLGIIKDRFRVESSSALCDTWNNVGVFILKRTTHG